jgi:hypothetical protein
MTIATIFLNSFYGSISEGVKQKYQHRYPSHKVTLELIDGQDLKPALELARVPPRAMVEGDREKKEFLYQIFLEEFVQEHGMYPWETPGWKSVREQSASA